MAGKKAFLTTALCSLVILIAFTGTAESASCCLRYTRRPLSCERLLGYTIQTINTTCDINAIIFHVPGRFVCADPKMKWTQKRIKCVDDKRQTTGRNTKTRTSSATTST